MHRCVSRADERISNSRCTKAPDRLRIRQSISGGIEPHSTRNARYTSADSTDGRDWLHSKRLGARRGTGPGARAITVVDQIDRASTRPPRATSHMTRSRQNAERKEQDLTALTEPYGLIRVEVEVGVSPATDRAKRFPSKLQSSGRLIRGILVNDFIVCRGLRFPKRRGEPAYFHLPEANQRTPNGIAPPTVPYMHRAWNRCAPPSPNACRNVRI